MIEVILIILVYAVVMLIGQKIDRAIEKDRNRIDIDEMFRELCGGTMTEENKVILDTDKLPNFADTFIDINTYRRLEQENKKLLEARNHFMVVNLKYFNALEEIREMAEYDCLRECSNDSEYCTVISCLEKRIQNKINEVLNDN